MPQINIEIQGTSGTVTRGRTFDAAVETRFLDWLWYAYPQVDGNGDPLPKNNANLAQAFRDYADGLIFGSWTNVKRYEKERDAQAARDAVPDITDGEA